MLALALCPVSVESLLVGYTARLESRQQIQLVKHRCGWGRLCPLRCSLQVHARPAS